MVCHLSLGPTARFIPAWGKANPSQHATACWLRERRPRLAQDWKLRAVSPTHSACTKDESGLQPSAFELILYLGLRLQRAKNRSLLRSTPGWYETGRWP